MQPVKSFSISLRFKSVTVKTVNFQTVSPEVTISLYGDDKNLVHLKLIEMGLAELDE